MPADPTDEILDVELPGSVTNENHEDKTMAEMDPTIAKVLDQGFAAAAVRRTDGADAMAENIRYDYLVGKGGINFAEGTAQRLVTEAGGGATRLERNRPLTVSE